MKRERFRVGGGGTETGVRDRKRDLFLGDRDRRGEGSEKER